MNRADLIKAAVQAHMDSTLGSWASKPYERAAVVLVPALDEITRLRMALREIKNLSRNGSKAHVLAAHALRS